MTAKYEHIATITLDSSASSVTFSSIPQGYRDLELIFNGSSVDNRAVGLEFNSDTTGHYSFVQMFANGSSAGSSSSTTTSYARAAQTPGASDPAIGISQIMDYSATDKHKIMLTQSGNTVRVRSLASRWPDTSAITSIKVVLEAGDDFLAGSTFDLYGIVGGA